MRIRVRKSHILSTAAFKTLSKPQSHKYLHIHRPKLINITAQNMALAIPKAVYQWNVTEGEGFESLKYSEQPLPQLGDSQVLVKCKLN